MPEYIQKLRVPARVALPGQTPMGGYFALAPQAEFRPGPETLLERLNTHDRVVPFIRDDDDATYLLARLGVEWVEAASSVDPGLVCPPSYRVTREEWVKLRFEGGIELEGLLQMELPESLNRATDFLNGPEDFFPLLRSDSIVLVNKHRVVDTRLFGSSPRPLSVTTARDTAA
jgi:hypothetical protein